MSLFDLVYLSTKPEFFSNCHSLHLEDLLDALAKKKVKDGQYELVINGDHVCRGRTKRYLLRKVNEFVGEMDHVDADVDMKQTVSLAQLDRLCWAFKAKRGRITSYAMIIFHVLLEEMRRENLCYDAEILMEYVNVIKGVVLEFYRCYPENELARFLLQSCETVITEIQQNTSVCKADFPGIPRRDAFDKEL